MTSSASFSRNRPVSTNTQVSCAPMARWISAAATAESTPPESPSRTSSPPTPPRIFFHGLPDVIGHVPGAAAPADFVNEGGEDRAALARVRHLRMELHAVEIARLVGHPAIGVASLLAMTLNPGGAT